MNRLCSCFVVLFLVLVMVTFVLAADPMNKKVLTKEKGGDFKSDLVSDGYMRSFLLNAIDSSIVELWWEHKGFIKLWVQTESKFSGEKIIRKIELSVTYGGHEQKYGNIKITGERDEVELFLKKLQDLTSQELLAKLW